MPLRPVLKVRKMSSRRGPPRKVQRWVRSAARIGSPWSSRSVGAEGPSPRPTVAVAADAALGDVELSARFHGFLREGRRRRQLDRLRLLVGIREAGVETLDGADDVAHFAVAQPWPARHRRVRHPGADHLAEVVVGRQRPIRRRAQLELAGREVARPRQQVEGRRSLPVALVAVALRAVLRIDLLSCLELRGTRAVGPSGGGEQSACQEARGQPHDAAAGSPPCEAELRAAASIRHRARSWLMRSHRCTSPAARGRFSVKS